MAERIVEKLSINEAIDELSDRLERLEDKDVKEYVESKENKALAHLKEAKNLLEGL